ncbi:MAG: DNA/RNA nuclease SfsA, partial [Anaerovoracaceae bacterium]
MKYKNIIEGRFIERPNRFVAIVQINGIVEKVHVKNTGRCKELLIEGAKVYLEDFYGRMGTRKMRYSLIGVDKGQIKVNMDSQAPNKMVEEALEDGRICLPEMGKLTVIKREKTYGDSRFDFYLEDDKGCKAFLEVKGVTLEKNRVAMFPDAPTERGVKHVKGLMRAVYEGYKGYVVLVIQMKGISHFTPNYETHKAFGEVL